MFYTFSVNISYQAFLNHYSGAASTVVVVTDNGIRLQLPASRFRPFLSQLGVKGRFRVDVNAQNKIEQIYQIG
ncbi:hypothetical protein A3K86_03185 [Photobacterium jeanii]|uniref:Topoisomerase II n=1 Tax=Photobacterium jeanii TaxID=858640 RepID=A0A178KLQ8_9GAMM|nr:DUF2835 domain-containing protein [Photobacterium jeanii]OAN17935.1 hypothetical protein A3K86_03185 [Photobacterium jeanii]PST92395.1 DUF2835 domain-containing protein [Photobacterium jeanii]